MFRPRIYGILLFGTLVLTTQGFSQQVAAAQIVENATLFGTWDSLRLTASMVIETPRTSARERGIQVYMKTEGVISRLLMEITTPASLRNLKFLSIKELENLTQWLNTSRGPRRIPVTSRPESIFDSDFFSTDFVPFSAAEYRITELGQKVVQNFLTRQFRLEPVGGVNQGSKVVSIEPQSSLILHIEFDAFGGSPPRTLEVQELVREAQGLRPRTIVMTTPDRNTSTILRIDSVSTHEVIPDSVFSRASW